METPVTGYTYAGTPGTAYLPASYTLRQASGGYNSNMGNFQVLPNGNMLLCIATAGVIKEFSPTGTLLWSKTATGAVPKAFRYDSCYVFNTPPAIPVISETNDTLYATTAITYQWYLNGQQIAGANNSSYAPTQDGIYIVRITDANRCVYRYSTDYHFSFFTGVSELNSLNTINVYPNPSNGIFHISGANSNELFEIVVMDAVGRVVMDITDSNVIDLTGNSKGIYFVRLTNDRNEIITRKISLNY